MSDEKATKLRDAKTALDRLSNCILACFNSDGYMIRALEERCAMWVCQRAGVRADIFGLETEGQG